MTHELKTDPSVYYDVAEGRKTFEIRNGDRDFEVGDTLVLRRTVYTGTQMRNNEKAYPLRYTGDSLQVQVTHIMRGPIYGLKGGWVILSIRADNKFNI